MKALFARQLQPGMKLLLPMGRTATIATVSVGRRFVTLTYEEDYPKGRVQLHQEMLIDDGWVGIDRDAGARLDRETPRRKEA